MKSIFGLIQDRSEHARYARILKPAGWRGSYNSRGRVTGYHKQLKKADLRELAYRLQYGIRS